MRPVSCILPLAVLVVVLSETEGGNIIPQLVESLVGSTTLHRTVEWKFDPKLGMRLNRDFERDNGHKSVILIEKLGLGIDGYQEERRAQQALRDSIPIENSVTLGKNNY